MAYFQSKLNNDIDGTCRICQQGEETLHHLTKSCERLATEQIDIFLNQIPLPNTIEWSIKKILKFIQLPLIET